MTELFLIAHKVSGEAAFDVATKMECPVCRDGTLNERGCAECDEEGYWWIIPTSGHRAYPYWHKLMPIEVLPAFGIALRWVETDKDFPVILNPRADWPDHYRHGPAPKVDIKALFKKSDLIPNPEAFIKRRL